MKTTKKQADTWVLPEIVWQFERESSLPLLRKGTHKQVKYARYCRHKLLSQHQNVMSLLPDADIQGYAGWYSRYKLRTDNRYWIDHRNDRLHDIWLAVKDWTPQNKRRAKKGYHEPQYIPPMKIENRNWKLAISKQYTCNQWQ